MRCFFYTILLYFYIKTIDKCYKIIYNIIKEREKQNKQEETKMTTYEYGRKAEEFKSQLRLLEEIAEEE